MLHKIIFSLTLQRKLRLHFASKLAIALKSEDKTKNVLSGQKRHRNDKNEAYDEVLQDSLNDEAKKQMEMSKNDQQGI